MKLLQIPADIFGPVSTIFQDPIVIVGLALSILLGLMLIYTAMRCFRGLHRSPIINQPDGSAASSGALTPPQVFYPSKLKIIVPDYTVDGAAYVQSISLAENDIASPTVRLVKNVWAVSVDERFREVIVSQYEKDANLLVIHRDIFFNVPSDDNARLYQSTVRRLIASPSIKHVLVVDSAVGDRGETEIENLRRDASTGELVVDAKFGKLMTIDEFKHATSENRLPNKSIVGTNP